MARFGNFWQYKFGFCQRELSQVGPNANPPIVSCPSPDPSPGIEPGIRTLAVEVWMAGLGPAMTVGTLMGSSHRELAQSQKQKRWTGSIK
jgi:hypothetical protein